MSPNSHTAEATFRLKINIHRYNTAQDVYLPLYRRQQHRVLPALLVASIPWALSALPLPLRSKPLPAIPTLSFSLLSISRLSAPLNLHSPHSPLLPSPGFPTCRIALEAFITCNEAETTGVILSGGVICLPGISLSLLLRNRQVLDHPTSTHVYRCLFGRKTQRKN